MKFESSGEMHRNQVGQNLHLVKKSFPKSLKEMPDLQFVILHER